MPAAAAPPPAAASPAAAAAPDPRPVLLLFAPDDEPFVRGFLVPALGPSAASGPAIDARDLGAVTVEALEQALAACSTTVAVISPAFFADAWARQAGRLADTAAIRDKLRVISLILVDFHLPLHIEAQVTLEMFHPATWDDAARRLRTTLLRPPAVDPAPDCPYPGMRPFEAADARFFYGRDAEITAVLALIQAGERELYLVGPSGAGKSSLIAAGVLPRLTSPPLAVCTMRPGDAPVRRLAACLDAPAVDAASVAAWAARHPGARLVVVIDQLEEVFTQAAPAEQAAFAAALAVLRAEPRCLLVLALRADFYAELMQSPLWLAGRAHVDLPPMRGAALREAIEQPARAQRVYLEPSLIERLLADAADAPNVLPLLQETLRQLWDHRRFCLVPLAAYDALGEGGRSGLAVAVSARADRCLRELSPAQVALAHRVLLRLVSFGEGRPDTRRRQTRARLAAGEVPAAIDAVLERLAAARLIVMEGDAGADDQVDLAHEALITAWPAFTAWALARRGDELRRRQIQASADEWTARGRGASGLLDAGELAAARTWRTTDAARELGESPEVTALVAASAAALARARRARVRVIASALAVLGVLAAAMSILALTARHSASVAKAERNNAQHERSVADTERGKAVRALGEQYVDTGRRALLDGLPQRAVPYFVAARALGIDGVALRALFHAATRTSVVLAIPHAGPVTAVRFTAGDTRLFTTSADGTARLWDARSGAPASPVLVHGSAIQLAAISDDGAHAVTTGEDDTVWAWDLTAAPPVKRALHHAARVNSVAFSGNGAVIVTACDDGSARLWSMALGREVARPFVHGTRVTTAALSRDGTRLVTTVGEGEGAALWNTVTGARVAPLVQTYVDNPGPGVHHDLVLSAEFGPDGTRVVTTSVDDTALVWDAATGKAITPPLVHPGLVTTAVLRPDNARVATAADDRRVRIWDVARGVEVGPGLIHPTPITGLAYSRDGARLLSLSSDKIVRLWDPEAGALLAAIDLEAGAGDAALSADATRVVTASADGRARVWDVAGTGPRVIARSTKGWPIYSAGFSGDGARVVAVDGAGAVQIATAAGALETARPTSLGAADLMFSRDGRRFALISSFGTVLVSDLSPFVAHDARVEDGVQLQTIGRLPARGALSPDGTRLATTPGERGARIWAVDEYRQVPPMLDHAAVVRMVRFSPDGKRVVTASQDGTARLWDAATRAPLGPPLVHPARTWVTTAVFSPDGRMIATVCTDNRVRLWDAERHVVLRTLEGHAGWIIGAAFSPDGARLVSWSDDRSARIWSVATGALAAPPLEHDGRVEHAAFSPDGARLATACGKQAQLWDVVTGRALGAALDHPDFVRTVELGPGGDTLLTTARDAVRIWDVALDRGTLAAWQHAARDGSYPQLRATLAVPAP